MKNILPKKLTLPVLMLLIVVSMGLIFWFAILPSHGFVVKKADEIQKFYASRENRQQKINRLPDLEKQYEYIAENEGRLNILLRESEIVDFVRTLERLASETRVEITIQSQNNGKIQNKNEAPAKKPTRKAGEPEPAKGTVEPTLLESVPYDQYLQVNIVLHGEYADSVQFLHRLETLPYALDVIGVQMKMAESEGRSQSSDVRNPFSIFPSDTDTTPQAVVEVVPQEHIETHLDTIIYISKEE